MNTDKVWETPLSFTGLQQCLVKLLGKQYFLIERNDPVDCPLGDLLEPLLYTLESTHFPDLWQGYCQHCRLDASFEHRFRQAFRGGCFYSDFLALLNISGSCLATSLNSEQKLHFLLSRLVLMGEELEVLMQKRRVLETRSQQIQYLIKTQPAIALLLRYELGKQREILASRFLIQGFLQDMLLVVTAQGRSNLLL